MKCFVRYGFFGKLTILGNEDKGDPSKFNLDVPLQCLDGCIEAILRFTQDDTIVAGTAGIALTPSTILLDSIKPNPKGKKGTVGKWIEKSQYTSFRITLTTRILGFATVVKPA